MIAASWPGEAIERLQVIVRVRLESIVRGGTFFFHARTRDCDKQTGHPGLLLLRGRRRRRRYQQLFVELMDPFHDACQVSFHARTTRMTHDFQFDTCVQGNVPIRILIVATRAGSWCCMSVHTRGGDLAPTLRGA